MISLVYPIAKHFKYAAEYQAAIPYYLQLISLYSKLCDYCNELEIIKDIQFMLNRIEMDENELARIEIETMVAKADCYKGLGRYTEAYGLYDDVLLFIDDAEYSPTLIDVYYNKGYCLYMVGKVMEAREILLSISEQFKLWENYKKDYFHIISLMASICDSTNDSATQRQLYLESLT